MTPPVVVKSVPENYSTNFEGDDINITFNEFIQLRDLQNQLIISPPMEINPDIRIKGKSLIIKLKDTLVQNATYTMNFGEAVSDITENNAVDNFQYVFSTGDYLDSLSVTGKVENARSEEHTSELQSH